MANRGFHRALLMGNVLAGTWLALLLGGVGSAYAAPAELALRRWAILASEEVGQMGLADLLAAELSSYEDIELVERGRLDAATRELKLADLFGANGIGARLKYGQLVGADVLLLLSVDAPAGKIAARSPTRSDEEPTIRWVISECQFGTRLQTGAFSWQPPNAEKFVKHLAAAADEIRKRYSGGIRQVVAVGPLISRDLLHTHDHLQVGLQHVMETALFAQEGLALLEIEEAAALATELQRTGNETRAAPGLVFLEGEYQSIAGTKNPPLFNVTINVRGEKREPRTLSIAQQAEVALARQLATEILPLVLEPGAAGSARPPDGKTQAQLLNARAVMYEELGNLSTALGFREAALLVAPDDLETRVLAIAHRRKLLGYEAPHTLTSAEKKEHAARLLDCWNHERRHVHELMVRKLVNFREAAWFNARASEVWRVAQGLYPLNEERLQPPEMQPFIDSVNEFHEEMSQSGKSLSADTAAGRDRVKHLLIDRLRPETDPWNVIQQRDVWISSLIETCLAVESAGVLPYASRVQQARVPASHRTTERVLQVLHEWAEDSDPPCMALVRLVLPGIQLAGVRLETDFVLIWNQDAWMMDQWLSDEEAENFARELLATRHPTNIFYADCLLMSRSVARPKVYEHDRRALPEAKRLLELARERQYSQDVIGRLEQIKKSIEDLASVAELYRADKEGKVWPAPPPRLVRNENRWCQRWCFR